MTPELFKTWRKSCGLTQEQAAESIGISRRMVQQYEAGEYPVPLYIELACCEVSRRLIGGGKDVHLQATKANGPDAD